MYARHCSQLDLAWHQIEMKQRRSFTLKNLKQLKWETGTFKLELGNMRIGCICIRCHGFRTRLQDAGQRTRSHWVLCLGIQQPLNPTLIPFSDLPAVSSDPSLANTGAKKQGNPLPPPDNPAPQQSNCLASKWQDAESASRFSALLLATAEQGKLQLCMLGEERIQRRRENLNCLGIVFHCWKQLWQLALQFVNACSCLLLRFVFLTKSPARPSVVFNLFCGIRLQTDIDYSFSASSKQSCTCIFVLLFPHLLLCYLLSSPPLLPSLQISLPDIFTSRAASALLLKTLFLYRVYIFPPSTSASYPPKHLHMPALYLLFEWTFSPFTEAKT